MNESHPNRPINWFEEAGKWPQTPAGATADAELLNEAHRKFNLGRTGHNDGPLVEEPFSRDGLLANMDTLVISAASPENLKESAKPLRRFLGHMAAKFSTLKSRLMELIPTSTDAIESQNTLPLPRVSPEAVYIGKHAIDNTHKLSVTVADIGVRLDSETRLEQAATLHHRKLVKLSKLRAGQPGDFVPTELAMAHAVPGGTVDPGQAVEAQLARAGRRRERLGRIEDLYSARVAVLEAAQLETDPDKIIRHMSGLRNGRELPKRKGGAGQVQRVINQVRWGHPDPDPNL